MIQVKNNPTPTPAPSKVIFHPEHFVALLCQTAATARGRGGQRWGGDGRHPWGREEFKHPSRFHHQSWQPIVWSKQTSTVTLKKASAKTEREMIWKHVFFLKILFFNRETFQTPF